MTETIDTVAEPDETSTAGGSAEKGVTVAKTRFAKALEEAAAGVQALRDEAVNRTGTYRDKLADTGSDLGAQAKALSGQARQKAGALAGDGKTRTSDALASLGKLVADKAPLIDRKLGPQFGDYARSTARQLGDTAARVDAKDLSELGEDARKFVRANPGAAIGIAAVAGFVLARLFGGSRD